jgi:hypothetical protein
MTPELQKELLSRLDALAAKLGTTSDHLWAILIRQAKIVAIEDALWILMAIAFSVLLGKAALWVTRTEKANEKQEWNQRSPIAWDYGPVIFFSGIAGVACLILDVLAFVSLFELPTLLLNPEYWALTQILQK